MINPVALGRCPVCGQRLGACGGPTTHQPVDTQVEEAATAMGEQKRYQLERDNGQAPAVLVLTEEEAKRLGATPADAAAADAKPARGKARTAENK